MTTYDDYIKEIEDRKDYLYLKVPTNRYKDELLES